MGQVVGKVSDIFRCNLLAIQTGGSKANTILAADEVWLVDTTNSLTNSLSGNCDAYIVGDGTKAATALELHLLADRKPTENSSSPVQSGGVYDELLLAERKTLSYQILSGKLVNKTAISNSASNSVYYTPVKQGDVLYWTGVFSANYMRAGFTTALPATGVAISNYKVFETAESGVEKTKTAPADGYFCVSFPNDGFTSLNIAKNINGLGTQVLRNIQGINTLQSEVSKKVDVKLGKNLFDYTKVTEGKYYSSTNSATESSSSNYGISDYIPVEAGENYFLSWTDTGGFVAGSGKIIFFNANKEYLSGIDNTQNIIIPIGASYIRFSIYYYNTPSRMSVLQFEKGTQMTSYERFCEIGGYLEFDTEMSAKSENAVQNKVVNNALEGKVNTKFGKNLFDKSTVVRGKYISASGLEQNNSAYAISDFIPVDENTTYFVGVSETSGTGTGAARHAFYNNEKSLISVTNVGAGTLLTSPPNAKYLRISLSQNNEEYFSLAQVIKGTEYGNYEPYSPVGGYDVVIKEGTIAFPMLDNELKNIIQNGDSKVVFSAFRNSDTLQAGDSMTLPQLHIEKNIFESVNIHGAFTLFRFGVGVVGTSKTYGSHWLEIDSTNVKLYNNYGNGDVLANTYAHGLTLTTDMTAEVDRKLNGNTFATVFTLYDNLGNSFEQQLSGWGYGTPFAENASASGSVDVTLTFMPRDVTKNIWCFGDSYFGFTYANKWNYYFAQKDMARWLSNNQPGLSPSSAYTDLVNLLATGRKPSYLLWCLGMNGGADTYSEGQYVINSGQKEVLDNVLLLCETYNITPILATIPTVPTRQKTGFCNYVRSLGVRYVDVAAAVGANEQGVWNTGLLSSDEVHPTNAGAKVIATQVMVDFPEITIEE